MHQKNYKKVKFQHVSAECVWSTAEKYPISGHAHNSRTVIGQKKLLMDTIKTQLRQNNTKISAESEMTLCHTSRRRWLELMCLYGERNNKKKKSFEGAFLNSKASHEHAYRDWNKYWTHSTTDNSMFHAHSESS